jgi:hypothetical protein
MIKADEAHVSRQIGHGRVPLSTQVEHVKGS